jgi:DNA-binding NarL/FixJ family response regulator|nr:LuxR C-terminal-related transcriptional regulator [Pseudomonas sp. Irchel s3b2]
MTNREQEVLHLLLDGKSNKQIAISLGISDFTVRDYVSSILRKKGVNSRSELFAATMKSTIHD